MDLRPRRITRSVAPVLQELESRRPLIVTRELLGAILGEVDSHLTATTAASRLLQQGWFLPLRTRGAWEFVPGEVAGRLHSGESFIELRAQIAKDPQAPVAVAFMSAVWELGHANHQPTVQTFAHKPDWNPPRALADYVAVSYDWRLPCVDRGGIPVWQPATAIVAMATLPRFQHDWSNADEWLPRTLDAADQQGIMREAHGRSTAALARLGYLAEWGGDHLTAASIRSQLPTKLPVTYLGPRSVRGKWNKKWRLYDSVLPMR